MQSRRPGQEITDSTYSSGYTSSQGNAGQQTTSSYPNYSGYTSSQGNAGQQTTSAYQYPNCQQTQTSSNFFSSSARQPERHQEITFSESPCCKII